MFRHATTKPRHDNRIIAGKFYKLGLRENDPTDAGATVVNCFQSLFDAMFTDPDIMQHLKAVSNTRNRETAFPKFRT